MRVVSTENGRVVVEMNESEWAVAWRAVEAERWSAEYEAEISEACAVDIEYSNADFAYIASVEAERAAERARVEEENEIDRARERAWYE